MKKVKIKMFPFLVIALFAIIFPMLDLPGMEIGDAYAASYNPPEFIKVGLTSTQGSGYAAGIAMYSAIEKKTGVKFPATVGAQPSSRFLLLKDKKVDIVWMTGAGMYFLLKGTQDFEQWGPQSVRTIWDGGGLDQGLATRKDTGIKYVVDMKGKRVASYDTYPAANIIMEAALAWGKLTWDDVKRVPVANYGAGMGALAQGSVDVAILSSLSGPAQEMAASVRGIHWIPYPNQTSEDKAAWERFQDIMPVYYPNRTPYAAGASKDNPVDIWAYNYQVVCYDTTSADLVYWIVKQMAENYEGYKDANKYLEKWTLDQTCQPHMWFAPRHEGAVKYLKEIGRWTPEMEKKQEVLLKKYP